MGVFLLSYSERETQSRYYRETANKSARLAWFNSVYIVYQINLTRVWPSNEIAKRLESVRKNQAPFFLNLEFKKHRHAVRFQMPCVDFEEN